MVALSVVILLFIFVFKTYLVRGSSMVPTLTEGNRVYVFCAFYTPSQGDVVIMDERLQIGDSIVKRVVATEGQVIDINNETGEITVDGVPFVSPIPTTLYNCVSNSSITYPTTVPEGYIFVMGDNRGNSFDSRYDRVGFIDIRDVIGRAIYVISPVDQFRKIK
ncbi:MAG: signal peptidase I [Oscillospiraceae bacterium]|nr:signal peptidase I [Oscillospiraceae bacterium]